MDHRQFEPLKDTVEFDGNSIKLTIEREKEIIKELNKKIEIINKLQENKMELKLNEVEVRKLNPQPGEVLLFTIKSDSIGNEEIQSLSDGLKAFFPHNKVAVLSVGTQDNIDLTIAQESSNVEEKGE